MPPFRRTAKGAAYQQLLDRASEAMSGAFYLEAGWIIFALLEDRLNSVLRLTGGIPTDKNGRPIQMLGKKLRVARERLVTDDAVRKAMRLGRDLDQLERWKDRRNDLAHSMANDARSWADLAEEASVLAADGRALVGSISSAVMRLKKMKRR